MKTKKGEVIFCVGLIIVLINTVSSQLLTSTYALHFIHNYEECDGKLLTSTLINPDKPFKLVYNIDKPGYTIIRIRFQTVSAAREIPSLHSELWGGIPGIQIHPQEDDPSLQQYTFDGMELDLKQVSGTEHSLMRFRLKFYEENQEKPLLVEMMIIAKPTTQEELRRAENYNAYDCNNFKSLQELMTRMTVTAASEQQIPVNLVNDFPWMKNVLDRAKFAGTTEHRSKTTYWYYAGAIMVNPDIINDILRLHPLWEGLTQS